MLLVHGDPHRYRLDHAWSGVPNFTRLETYATRDSDRWVLITIDPSRRDVFTFESKRT